jgi:hypothetical protein
MKWLSTRFPKLQQRCRELETENARLTSIITDPDLVSMEMKDGTLDMKFHAPMAMKILAASFHHVLGDAPNWQALEIGPMDHEGTMVSVTVRRMNGETPEETVGKLRSMVTKLQQEIDDLHDRADHNRE